ncbi:MAG: hypothetical protein JWL91_522 [Sphingomonas bacterium]|nr:hypothetical protein [Sphingomonas bacterium]
MLPIERGPTIPVSWPVPVVSRCTRGPAIPRETNGGAKPCGRAPPPVPRGSA